MDTETPVVKPKRRSLLLPAATAICCCLVLILAGLFLNDRYHVHLNRALQAAIERGDANLIRTALDRGADVNAPITDKVTKPTMATYFKAALRGPVSEPRHARTLPLMIAVVNHREDLVRLLLDRGAKVDGRDEYGFTALSMAISGGQKEMAHLLLERGADPNAPNDVEMPPLIWAVMMKKTAIVKDLLAHGADVNSRDADGLSALYMAAMNRDDELALMLLKQGADPNTTYKKVTVLWVANDQKDWPLTRALRHWGANR